MPAGQKSHAVRASALQDRVGAGAGGQSDPEVHAAFGPREARALGQRGFQTRKGSFQGGAAGVQYIFQMLVEATGTSKFEHDGLAELVGMKVRPLFGLAQALDPLARPDDPADAETREGDFGKTAQEKRLAAGAELAQGGQGLAPITEAGVNVDLHGEAFEALGFLDDGLPLVEAHGAAEGVGEVRREDLGGDGGAARVGSQATAKGAAQPGINGFFDENLGSGDDEGASDEIKGLLAAGRDEEVVLEGIEDAFLESLFDEKVTERSIALW